VYEDFNGASAPLGAAFDVAASTAVESLELLGEDGSQRAYGRSPDELKNR
jgi:hypothetical protein